MSHFIQLIKKIQTENIAAMAPRREVCDAFTDHANLYLKRTAWASGCRSWFKRGKEDGPLAMWPGSRLLYFELLAQPRYEDYDIQYQSGNPFGFLGNGFTLREYDGRDLSYYLGTKETPGALMPGTAPSAPQHTDEMAVGVKAGNGLNGVAGVNVEEVYVNGQ